MSTDEKAGRNPGYTKKPVALILTDSRPTEIIEDVLAAFANGEARALQALRDLRRARLLKHPDELEEAGRRIEAMLLSAALIVAKGRKLLADSHVDGDGEPMAPAGSVGARTGE